MEELYDKALGKKEITEEPKENVIIVSKLSNLQEYENMRANSILPLAIVLTEFQSRIVFLPFDGLYIKSNLTKENQEVFTLDLRVLKKKINDGQMELEGIRLEDGEIHKVDSMYGGDYNSLGSFIIGERKEEIMELTKKLLEPKESANIKLRKELVDDKSEKYYIPTDTFF